jgi:hypothetical protein
VPTHLERAAVPAREEGDAIPSDDEERESVMNQKQKEIQGGRRNGKAYDHARAVQAEKAKREFREVAAIRFDQMQITDRAIEYLVKQMGYDGYDSYDTVLEQEPNQLLEHMVCFARNEVSRVLKVGRGRDGILR